MENKKMLNTRLNNIEHDPEYRKGGPDNPLVQERLEILQKLYPKPIRNAKDPFFDAVRRVGQTAGERVCWLLRVVDLFPETKDKHIPLKEQTKLQWECLAFSKDRPGQPARLPSAFDSKKVPSWAEVRKAISKARRVVSDLRQGHFASIAVHKWEAAFSLEGGKISGGAVTDLLPFSDGFQAQVYNAFVGLEREKKRLHICKNQKCNRLFIPQRKTKKTCSRSSCRTLAWRQTEEGRKKFGEIRFEAYVRKLAKQSGRPIENLRAALLKKRKQRQSSKEASAI